MGPLPSSRQPSAPIDKQGPPLVNKKVGGTVEFPQPPDEVPGKPRLLKGPPGLHEADAAPEKA